MSLLEPDVERFFKLIAKSVFLGLFWILLVMIFGIYFRLMFFDEGIRLENIIYYIAAATSFFFLLRYYLRIWKEKFPHG